MCDTDHSGQVCLRNFCGKIRNARNTPHPPQRALLKNGNTARVVAAIFEASQSLGQHRSDIAPIHCSYDSAHEKPLVRSGSNTNGLNYQVCCIATKHRHRSANRVERGAKR
jgi:hypothetical protein